MGGCYIWQHTLIFSSHAPSCLCSISLKCHFLTKTFSDYPISSRPYPWVFCITWPWNTKDSQIIHSKQMHKVMEMFVLLLCLSWTLNTRGQTQPLKAAAHTLCCFAPSVSIRFSLQFCALKLLVPTSDWLAFSDDACLTWWTLHPCLPRCSRQ